MKNRKKKQNGLVAVALSDECATAGQIIEATIEQYEVPQKVIFDEENPFLKPILLNKKIAQEIRFKLGKTDDDVYLWNKLVDPCLHPNDYINSETPLQFKGFKNFALLGDEDDEKIVLLNPKERLQFKWILSPCQGVIGIASMWNEGKKVEEENLCLQERKSPDDTKFKEVMKNFKSLYCVGNCSSAHYLIAIGKYRVGSSLYSGIHIVLYPDYHPEDTLFNKRKVNDPLYGKFLKEKDIPGIQYKRPEYRKQYIAQFKETLENLR